MPASESESESLIDPSSSLVCLFGFLGAMVLITAMDLLSEEEVVRAPAPTPTVVSTGGGGAGAAGGAARRPGEPDRAAQWPCPRCESTDTKFCYYNNYNHAQPRHFCKGCRRYWTRGGALRNVPVGGGTRKVSPAGVRRKRPSHSHAAAAAPSSTQPAPVVPLSVSAPAPLPLLPPQQYELTFLPPSLSAMDPDRHLLDLGGNFSSLLTPPAPLLHNAPNFATSFVFGGAGAGLAHAHVPAMPQQAPVVSQALPEGFWAMGWPDLSI